MLFNSKSLVTLVALLSLETMLSLPSALAKNSDIGAAHRGEQISYANADGLVIRGGISNDIMTPAELLQDLVFSDPEHPVAIKDHLPRILKVSRMPDKRRMLWLELKNTDLSSLTMRELQRFEKMAHACHLPVD